MKNLKRTLGLLTAVLAFCMVFALNVKVDAAEASPLKEQFGFDAGQTNAISMVSDVTTDSFAVAYGTLSTKRITVQVVRPTDAKAVEVALFDYKGNQVATTQAALYAFFDNIKLNASYTLRARAIGLDGSIGAWSAERAFALPKTTGKVQYNYRSGTKSCTIKTTKKSNGIKGFAVYVSNQNQTGFKKVKTVKPGATVKVSKYKGKSLKTGTTYYVRIVPILKNNITSDSFTYYTV